MPCPNDGRPSRDHRDTGPCATCYKRDRRAVLTALRAGQPCPTCGTTHRRADGRPKCFGHRRNGTACGRGPEAGLEVCGTHGGGNSVAKAFGQQRDTERKAAAMAIRLAVPIEVTASDAVIQQIHIWAGLEAFYAEKVAQVQAGGGDDALIWGKTKTTSQGVVVPGKGVEEAAGSTEEAAPSVWIVLHERAADRLTKTAFDAIRIGIEERKVRLAEQQGALVADVIKRVQGDMVDALNKAGLLTADVLDVLQGAFIESAPRHLRLLVS